MAGKIDKPMKVLFFSAWYPHRYDAMAGLFVRKHAEAVSQFADVCVLFPFADEHVHKFEIVEQKFGAVTEIYVYYPFCKNRFFRKLSSNINCWRAFRKGYKRVLNSFGQPDICNDNVLTFSGFLAYWLKMVYHIPYVVTEHWSGYLEQNGSFEQQNSLKKWLMRKMARKAGALMPVSKILENKMLQCGLYNDTYVRIDNVVDDFFYLPHEKQSHRKKRILHISCFDEKAKNICGMLRAIKQVSLQRQDFEFVIVGTGADFQMVVDYAKSLNFPVGMVQFIGEQTPEEVCEWFYQSDFFLFFSNYETAGVVISESLVCGKPVISTPVGIAPEVICADNGRLVPIGNEVGLCEQIGWMLDHFKEFDQEKIKQIGQQFTYAEVGAKLMRVYQNALF
jgi:glycosyltransferase involved in cell wall biosynthesis